MSNQEQNAMRRQADPCSSDDAAALTARVDKAEPAAVSDEACQTGVKVPGASPSAEALEAASDWFNPKADRPRRPFHRNLARHFDTFAARLIAEKDAEIATLRERLEWPDISTAPKDGSTIVDLWCVHPNLPAQRSANMVYRRGKWVTAGIIVEPLNPGWTATHWLPLPTTPTPKESKGE